jgi:hypothetical protein
MSKYLPPKFFASVVLPHCRGPSSETAGYFSNFSTTNLQ